MKKRVAILFGGPSGEHDVSIQSAVNIYKALNSEKYERHLIGLDHQAVWRVASEDRPLLLLDDGGPYSLDAPLPPCGHIHINREAPAVAAHVPGEEQVVLVGLDDGAQKAEIDIFFPVAHGSYGEDGCLQGMLEMLGVPFVGAGVLGSAVGMDKDVMKRLLRDRGIPGPRFVVARKPEKDQLSFDVLSRQLGAPLFVKPCNLGSSVGIHKVSDADAFETALTDAFQYDRKIIIEEGVKGRELECAVLGGDPPRASVAGEIIVHADFYSYHAKYEDEHGAELCIPADVSPEQLRAIQEMAIAAFECLECAGLARVDFFLLENGQLLLNEINTLPGFTRISMYPKLWQAAGLEYGELLDRLLDLALDRYAREKELKRSY